MNLDKLRRWTFNVFDKLLLEADPNGYQINFSAGKDSHLLAGMYLDWEASTGKRLRDIRVVFVDTLLEAPMIYELVDGAEKLFTERGIPFIRTKPRILDNFWVKQFGLGYTVPYWGARWCTGKMKINPMKEIGGIAIAGSHLGESTTRDTRLKNCGSTECGIDMLEAKVEPIAVWRNCNVWDWIMIFADQILYPGVSEKLTTLYDIADSADGSLRMGCFFCPVVLFDAIKKQVEQGIIPPVSLQVRNIIEKLRIAPRIMSPQKKDKPGAILVDARIALWEEFKPLIPELKKYGWISDSVIIVVEDLLEHRSYPPTYTYSHIKKYEPLAKPWDVAFEDAQFMLDQSQVEALELEVAEIRVQLRQLNNKRIPLLMKVEDLRYYKTLNLQVADISPEEALCQQLNETIADLERSLEIKQKQLSTYISAP